MHSSIISFAAWAACAAASVIDLTKRDTPLQVTLSPISDSNSKVKATVTNTADRGYNVYYKGSFLDSSSPVDKFVVSGTSKRASFNGVLLRMATTGTLSATNFVPIEPHQTIETEIDIAELYDVETTDTYVVRATGAMPYADINSTTLTGDSVAFSSNALTLDIDGDMAKATPYAIDAHHNLTLARRTELSTSGCSSSDSDAIAAALNNCAVLASAAAEKAANGSSTKFREYFKTTSASARQTVSQRFLAVAADCAYPNRGATTTSCGDTYNYCDEGVLAYTLPSYNHIAYCPLFYSVLEPVSQDCHDQDQATTVLHEETHADGVMSPGTEDYAYGYSAQMQLDASEAVMNADSYAMFANAIYVGC